MKIIQINKGNLAKELKGLRRGSSLSDPGLEGSARKIVEDVRKNGDRALFKYTKRFDRVALTGKTVRVSKKEFREARKAVPKQLLDDLIRAGKRIRDFHRLKLPSENTFRDTLGNELGWVIRPIERAGLYVPGGKAAYPSTVLMTAIPAKVAGVRELVLVTPCPGGELNPAVLAAAEIAGVDSVYKVGGAQAVAALAYGTESVPRVDKIVGPGNIYVAIAKKLVFGVVDIDMIAGPSEVLIIADGSAPAEWVAADLLAQAEHDEMAVPIVVTNSLRYAKEIEKEVSRQLLKLVRKAIAGVSVRKQGRIFVTGNIEQAIGLSNALAPEHLELCVRKPKSILKKINHAGAIFLGSMSTEAFGDYIAGPSHVLPTGGAARFSSPLSVYDFLRMPSVISISKRGFDSLSESVMNLAYSEGLEAHALSVAVRLDGNQRSGISES
ncbi:MAG: histidinol dehydrogenase [Candidatus Dadabacteria bacterium RIFCSPHIGHO2_12_FULL_53_21]|nr:MAG: histidinol dehydrogenase [Candidatus Dadabacteria bacterium RIFCSPHIGHO2_12_FULL_53_21]